MRVVCGLALGVHLVGAARLRSPLQLLLSPDSNQLSTNALTQALQALGVDKEESTEEEDHMELSNLTLAQPYELKPLQASLYNRAGLDEYPFDDSQPSSAGDLSQLNITTTRAPSGTTSLSDSQLIEQANTQLRQQQSLMTNIRTILRTMTQQLSAFEQEARRRKAAEERRLKAEAAGSAVEIKMAVPRKIPGAATSSSGGTSGTSGSEDTSLEDLYDDLDPSDAKMKAEDFRSPSERRHLVHNSDTEYSSNRDRQT